MNNLIKAECFRLRHSGNTIMILLFVGIVSVFFQFVGNEGVDMSARHFFIAAFMGIIISTTGIAGIVSGTFNSRLAHYEIMKGTPPMQMILSKMLITLLIETVIYYLPSFIILYIYNSETVTLTMALLFYVCVIKSVIFSVALCAIFKDAAGVVIYMFSTMFQTIPLVILQNLAGINVVPLTSMLTSTQIMLIGNLSVLDMEELSMPLNTEHTEIKIIFSCILLIAVMFPIAYKSLKDKWEINLITQK